jgi:nucleoside-diphosphate-sugar epimerase
VKILVTGAAGFLGSEVSIQLRSAGHEIVRVDKRGPADWIIDLADESAVRRLPDVDTVIHSAAVQYVSTDLPFVRRRIYFERNNVAATQRLVERYNGTGAHFINIGSSMMYEQSGAAVYDISSPWRPQGVYTASKIAAQRDVERMSNPTACVIPCIIAGGGRGGLFASLVQSMRRWRTAICPGPGAHQIHLVHVRDAASLIARVAEGRATGRFNAASPGPLSIGEWIREMADEMGMPEIRRLMLPLRPLEIAAALSRYRLLAREQVVMLRLPHVLAIDESLALGWTPRYTNAEIVRETARTLTASSPATARPR